MESNLRELGLNRNDDRDLAAIDLRPHINLIQKHGYKGRIARYVGPAHPSFRQGEVLLVQEQAEAKYDGTMPSEAVDWHNAHRTVERPMSEEDIREGKGFAPSLVTVGTCVGVPVSHLQFILI